MTDVINADVTNKVSDYDVVLVNEGQFFENLNQNVRH
jgi:hypothetical protein